jgi:hypothetical protein
VDEAFAREMEFVKWFSQCGQPLTLNMPFPVTQVGDWTEAIEQCSDQRWEETTLEARNRLTAFLFTHHRDAYSAWNTITDTVKERVITPLVDRVWQPFAERHRLGKAFVDCVSWDVLAGMMEHEYRCCSGRPMFFLHLLQVYRAGHFPCGWSGEWPAGKLIVL